MRVGLKESELIQAACLCRLNTTLNLWDCPRLVPTVEFTGHGGGTSLNPHSFPSVR